MKKSRFYCRKNYHRKLIKGSARRKYKSSNCSWNVLVEFLSKEKKSFSEHPSKTIRIDFPKVSSPWWLQSRENHNKHRVISEVIFHVISSKKNLLFWPLELKKLTHSIIFVYLDTFLMGNKFRWIDFNKKILLRFFFFNFRKI